MKQYIKNLYSTVPPKSFEIPTFIGQREEFTCCQCHCRTVIAVPTTGIDWERVAMDYKQMCESLLGDVDDMLSADGYPPILMFKLVKLLEKARQQLGKKQPPKT
jgi:hypothetical protein